MIKEALLWKIGEADEEKEMITVHPQFHLTLQAYTAKPGKPELIYQSEEEQYTY